MRIQPLLCRGFCLLALVLCADELKAQSFGIELHNTMMPASGGMAGVSIAEPQDLVSAINANPATLTQFQGTQFLMGGGWVEPTFDLAHIQGQMQFLGTFSAKCPKAMGRTPRFLCSRPPSHWELMSQSVSRSVLHLVSAWASSTRRSWASAARRSTMHCGSWSARGINSLPIHGWEPTGSRGNDSSSTTRFASHCRTEPSTWCAT